MSLANSAFAHLHNCTIIHFRISPPKRATVQLIVTHANKTILLLAFQFCYRVHDNKIVHS